MRLVGAEIVEVVVSCWHWMWCGGKREVQYSPSSPQEMRLIDKHTFPVHQEMLFTLCMSAALLCTSAGLILREEREEKHGHAAKEFNIYYWTLCLFGGGLREFKEIITIRLGHPAHHSTTAAHQLHLVYSVPGHSIPYTCQACIYYLAA